MIVICTNEVAGPTGYHKSVVQLANGLHRAGYAVALLGFLGTGDVASRMMPRWPLDVEVPAFTLRSLPAEGGRLLHRDVHPGLSGNLGGLRYSFTANELAALRQLNGVLSGEDTIVFTAPVQALAFQHALGGDVRGPRTVLQIHGDYLHHVELWEPLMAARGVIDRLQTVADGLREQFVPAFDASDVVFVPNFPGEGTAEVARVAHEGVNIALPASFQHRKNQLDAIRALSLVDDPSVRLTLWGNISPLNPYFIAVQQSIEDLGLQDRVSIPGFGSEADVYGSADVVLMTSLSEGFPYPLLEAMYQSRPTVSYDFDFGPREAIEDAVTGFIVPVGDVEGLAGRLAEIAGDAALRERMGSAARRRYDALFSPEAVEGRYREFLGPVAGRVDLAEVFSTDGVEPVGVGQIAHEVRRVGSRRVHRVTVTAPVGLYDVEADDGTGTVPISMTVGASGTRIELEPSPARIVLSYAVAPGSPDRRYLADIDPRYGFQVSAHLRRDARRGAGCPPVEDALVLGDSGARRLRVAPAVVNLAKRAPQDVAWKVRQIAPDLKNRARARRERDTARGIVSRPSGGESGGGTGDRPGPTRLPAPAHRPAPAPRAAHSIRPAGESVLALGTSAVTSVMRILGRQVQEPSTSSRRVLPRHPWFPVSSGVDGFGVPVNGAGGVEVSNSGSVERPSVSVRGEFDVLVLRDGVSQRRVVPPWSYGELFEGVCAAEREYGLFDIATAGGVHVWELGRSALVIQLAEAAGLWGAASAVGSPVRDVYEGSKSLVSAPAARTVVFDYVRRGQSGYRTAPFVGDDSLFVVQPDADGYPGVTESNLVYPFGEFTQWRSGWRRRWDHLRVPEVDARPFEEALSSTLGIEIDLGDHLRNRLAKFLAEREFFTPVFERVGPEEVLIASSHWWAGIGAAAVRSGARVSDIQYALTSRYAPSFWFGGRPHYGASRFYAWSDLWAARTNAYEEHVVVPREQPELRALMEAPSDRDRMWDVCVISQPRVLRRILAFVSDLVRERPDLRVVIAPHPAQREIIAQELAAVGLTDAVSVAEQDTLTTVASSVMAVGTFSTSMWEAAALGVPAYVIEVPGHEETLEDVATGLFRVARTPHDLVPFEVPESRRNIFG